MRLFARASSAGPPPRLLDEAQDLARKAASEPRRQAAPIPHYDGIAPGTRIGDRYEVQAELGRGGVGTVYRARDLKFELPVALKVAAASGEAAADFEARFRREARISYLMGKAPGIIRALDWGRIEGGHALYLVMDLVPGAAQLSLDKDQGELMERLERLAKAASLVAVVHGFGIVHRDIKPQNFLISGEGELFLGDFGTAKSLDSALEDVGSPAHLTRTGLVIGSPLYMAPEQLHQPRQVGRQADVYSLGIMLYKILTGRHPYDGESATEILSTQLKVRYGLAPHPPSPARLNPSVPPALDRLCSESIKHDPDERVPDAGVFLERLRAGLKPSLESATPIDSVVLRLDSEGFTLLDSLRQVRSDLGRPRFASWLKGVTALAVRAERAIEGRRQYVGRVLLLQDPLMLIGRGPDCAVRIDLPSISARHLQLRKTPAGWVAVDQKTVNGTELNGTRLQGACSALSPGDRLRLAQHVTLEVMSSAALEGLLDR